VTDEATDKIIAALTLLTAPRPTPGEVPAWAKGTWVHPWSFQSGVRYQGVPTKPASEQTTNDRVEIFLASIGRSNSPSMLPTKEDGGGQ
jgi:hypothetical protein